MSSAAATGSRASFARMRRNIAWLLGGRGFQAVASIAYLGLAARSLGPEGFGTFTLILAYGQSIANLAQFQSWQGVIRYGALHLARTNERRLARLIGFTATLDWLSAVAGALIALFAVHLVGPWLGWSAQQQGRAAIFGAALLLSIGATPAGILRLLDRFDLITYCQAVGPATRLVGSVAAWWLGGGLDGFLAVWAGAALLQSAVTWTVALGRAGRRPALGRRRFGIAVRENAGIWRFMVVTNASSTLSTVAEQLGTLAVGGVAGATMAGGYRLASKLAKALARPVQIMARVVYPELARLTAERDEAAVARVAGRTALISVLLAVVLVVVLAVAGPAILALVAGPNYRFAHDLLLILGVASAIDLSGFVLEPLLTARGRAGTVLGARVLGAAAFAGLLAILLPRYGASGAAMAAVGSALVIRIRLGFAVRRGPPADPLA